MLRKKITKLPIVDAMESKRMCIEIDGEQYWNENFTISMRGYPKGNPTIILYIHRDVGRAHSIPMKLIYDDDLLVEATLDYIDDFNGEYRYSIEDISGGSNV